MATAPVQVLQDNKKWPFVETPGEFTDRLLVALKYFNGDMLAAVRNVLIENPPVLHK